METLQSITRRLERVDMWLEVQRLAIAALASQIQDRAPVLRDFDEAIETLKAREQGMPRPDWHLEFLEEIAPQMRQWLSVPKQD